MFFYMLKIRVATFFSNLSAFFSNLLWKHKKQLILGSALICILVAGFFGARLAINSIRTRIALNNFLNMPREDMIYDFEYLMTALEENWPFFNLSVSANNVDVRVLANNTRALLNDPVTGIENPFDFLDLLQKHFFEPINQLGHLHQVTCDELFFITHSLNSWSMQHGALDRITHHVYAVVNRPQVQMFYNSLRDAGRGMPQGQLDDGPVMQFDIIEAGRIAHMRVNRMIRVWDDFWIGGLWRHYEWQAYRFNQEIEGFEHLIIDLRGNPGGQAQHFLSYVMPMFLHEGIVLPAYLFYLDGVYSNLTRELFDIRFIWPAYFHYDWEDLPLQPPLKFSEPLPYLDPQLEFALGVSSRLNSVAVDHYLGYVASAKEEVLFNGKIWLLTDTQTASAAEGVAALLKYNGIATVVGEPTLGLIGAWTDASTITTSLPNTGIMIRFDVAYYTDHQGRPLQGYGIIPHYLNRPGMDALETVLAMIEENG